MIREEIEINMYPDYYEMRIFFVFHNSGDTIVLDVGFPEYSFGTQTITSFSNFRSSINGNWVDIMKNENHQNNDPWIKINAWYAKQVEFKANRTTTSIVEYRADYAHNGPFNSIEYLYGTGSTWKDSIGEMKITVNNHSNYWIRSFHSMIENNIKIDNKDGRIIILALNVAAHDNDTFSITFSKEPIFMNPFRHYFDLDPFVLDKEIISTDNLILLTQEQLRLLRNSIYANHGYIFNSQDLKEYFNEFKLHRPNENFNENDFSEIERINLQNIINEENWRK
jgi:hypothetical protein